MKHALLRLAVCSITLALAGSGLGAQTTHTVQVGGTSGLAFNPSALTIKVGDSVQWVKTVGLHSVESGVGGVHDGIFRSGDPTTSSFTFTVVFDAAFVTAHPVPNDLYNYYCAIHFGFGMVGSITVTGRADTTLRNDAGNVNPLSYTATKAILGSNFVGTVNLATTGHAFAALLGYLSPLTLPLAGGQVVLVNIADPAGEVLMQAVQPGPTAVFSIAVPNDLALCGITAFTQAVHIGGVAPFRLSNAQDVKVGAF